MLIQVITVAYAPRAMEIFKDLIYLQIEHLEEEEIPLVSELKIGQTVYIPIIDIVNVGFAIEEMLIKKLIGTSKSPCGLVRLTWTFGDVSFIKEQFRKRSHSRIYYHTRCFETMDACLKELEKKKKEIIAYHEEKRKQVIDEIKSTEEFLAELKKESVEVSRNSNKKINMLKRLDIRDNLERMGLYEAADRQK